MGRLRVLRAITRMNVGGPAQQAMLLSARLDPAQFETLLVAGQPALAEGDMTRLRPLGPFRTTTVRELGREIAPLADIRALTALIRIARGFRPHIVHTHLAKAGVIGRLAARATGVPIVIHTFHGTVLRGYFDPVRSFVFAALERTLSRMSTRIVAISPRQLEEIRRLGIAYEPRLIEIPLGVSLRPFLDPPRGDLRRELGLKETDPLIGIVCRLVPIKAVEVFIDAVALLARSDARLRAVVVGDGERREQLEALAAQRGLGARVIFLGWRADLDRIYGDLDVLLMTSDNEGTPVSLLEGLAAGRPVVATAVGGVPDIIGADQRGILVAPRDPGAVAEAVRSLLADPARAARLGRAGRAYVHPQYDEATLVQRIEHLYLELAREHRALELRP